MTPPQKAAKKAAKKTAKKAAKKAAGHHHDQHRRANDLLRAYEHMGRVAALRQSAKTSAADAIAELAALAQREIEDGHTSDAADLLRASEHLSFAALVDDGADAGRISAELEMSITERFEELTRKAEEHWGEGERTTSVAGIYRSSRNSAARAFRARAFHQALEFARAAEALAHVKRQGPDKLGTGNKALEKMGV